jgi:hypothetical protein
MKRVDQDGWESCPTGELDRLAGRLWARRTRRALLGAAGALVAAGAIGLAAVQLVGAFSGGPSGGGGCQPAPSGCQPVPAPAPCPATNP